MATNLVRKFHEYPVMPVACSHPATPTSGKPVRFGTLTGVALTDEGDGGNLPTETTVNFGSDVWDLVVDDNEGGGIAVGDDIYYHDTGTGTGSVNLNNSSTGNNGYFGKALEVVSANATTLINVLHIPTVSSITAASDTGAGVSLFRAARFTFDPTANAGDRTIGAHVVGPIIPDNALILGGGMEILTTFTSATDAGTIAASVEGANDLVTATAISSGTFWDAVKYKGIVPTALELAGVATPIKLTAARQVTFTVAVEALTAGKLVGWVFYMVGE